MYIYRSLAKRTEPHGFAMHWTLNRSRSQHFTAEALSMLKTPPVRRKSLSKPVSIATSVELATTPQSILKVRHRPVRRSPSPLQGVPKLRAFQGRLERPLDLHLFVLTYS